MRIFLDANILFSASKSSGAIRELLIRASAAGHVLCADEYVVTEARRNLELKAPETVEYLQTLLKNIELTTIEAQPLPRTLVPDLPDKDRPVLAAAIRLHCSALITGDKSHFGPLYGVTVDGVTVYSPRAFAEAQEL